MLLWQKIGLQDPPHKIFDSRGQDGRQIVDGSGMKLTCERLPSALAQSCVITKNGIMQYKQGSKLILADVPVKWRALSEHESHAHDSAENNQ